MENELHRKPATPEEVWSFLRTSSEKAARETEELRELMKETDRRLKKLDRLFNSQWSKLMESLVEGDLVGLLQAQGIAVERTCTNVKGGRDGRHYEFDILAVNGEEVVVVKIGDRPRFLELLS